MEIKKTVEIISEVTGLRLDQAVAKLCPDYSRSILKDWILKGLITLDGKKVKPREKVTEGQTIQIDAVAESHDEWQAQDIPLNIIFEDDHVLVINKPAGLVVHPGAGNRDQTLLNALLNHCPGLTHIPRAGIVHRIDKDTTGLLVVAKTLKSHTLLVAQLQEKTASREYVALVHGEIISGATIKLAMARHPKHRTQMAVVHQGKPAVTHYRILEKFEHHTLLRVILETGRTHQIRVHMAHIKHPLVGDKTYGGRFKIPANINEELLIAIKQFPRQALHARQLGFVHPETGEECSFECPIPEDLQTLIDMLHSNESNN